MARKKFRHISTIKEYDNDIRRAYANGLDEGVLRGRDEIRELHIADKIAEQEAKKFERAEDTAIVERAGQAVRIRSMSDIDILNVGDFEADVLSQIEAEQEVLDRRRRRTIYLIENLYRETVFRKLRKVDEFKATKVTKEAKKIDG